MCFSVALTRETIENDPRFHHLLDELYQNPGFRISGFSFPGMPVLKDLPGGKAVKAHWGLIPAWVREEDKARRIRSGTLNARWETAGEKPSFRDSWPGKRCMLPVEGFYEPHVEQGKKSTWYICRKDRKLMYLGGIFQYNHNLNPPFPSLTFSILTLEARELLAEVHNEKLRMPLILDESRFEEWLSPDGPPPPAADHSFCLNQDCLEAWEAQEGGRDKKAPPSRKNGNGGGDWTQGSLF